MSSHCNSVCFLELNWLILLLHTACYCHALISEQNASNENPAHKHIGRLWLHRIGVCVRDIPLLASPSQSAAFMLICSDKISLCHIVRYRRAKSGKKHGSVSVWDSISLGIMLRFQFFRSSKVNTLSRWMTAQRCINDSNHSIHVSIHYSIFSAYLPIYLLTVTGDYMLRAVLQQTALSDAIFQI